MNRKNNIKYNRRWSNHNYVNTYTRINKNKNFTYIYYFEFDHDEDLNTPHITDPTKSEYIRIRDGKRAVFYENIDKREQITNSKK